MTLTEFLRQHQAEWGARAAEREALRAEWVRAVERLLAQLRQWLQEADPDGYLQVTTEMHEISEEALGRYQAPGLRLTLGRRQVRVVPKGRTTLGPLEENGGQAHGLVVMTDGAFDYSLYRIRDDRGERWILVDEQDYRITAFDRAAFEAALMSLLE